MILDCTFRDGGYYVNWDFDEETVKKYLSAVGIANIDILEIGFRFLPQHRFLGAFAYCSDDYLKTLPLPKNLAIAVMVNAAELLQYDGGVDSAVHCLFGPSEDSPVDIVRVAAYARDVTACKFVAKELVGMGYRVFLNLMQVDALTTTELSSLAEEISGWNSVEALFFADSFGGLEPNSVREIVKAISSGWTGPIGIHAHDNKGQAHANCMAALEFGVTYLDGTILGMGRGAGNAQTENLLIELTRRGHGSYYADALYPLVLHEFSLLKQRYHWGPNIYYFLAATHRIHPTYVQVMMSDERYGAEHILSAVNLLKSTEASSYSVENMLRAVSGLEGSEIGGWSATGWLKGRSVLILGSGPGTHRFIKPLQHFAQAHNLFVLCLNINDVVPLDMVDAYVACHEIRVLIESDSYSALRKPFILPLARISESIQGSLLGLEVYDYGLRVEKGCFTINETGCVLSKPLALAYAIAAITAAGAKRVFLAGFDGYGSSDPRQQEMVDVLEDYKQLPHALRLSAITPTTYPVEQCSLYQPDLIKD